MRRFKLLQKASAFCQRLCRRHRQVVVSGPTEGQVATEFKLRQQSR